jgi:hypothetical protein
MLNRTALIGLLLLGAANVAAGQEQRQQVSAVNVNRLPIDLHRVQRDLRQAAASQSENRGLKIAYRVDVYGQAPRIEIFTKADKLQSAAVPYGAPTHQDMMDAHTRAFDGRDPAYRAPALMDFNSVLAWLADKTRKK